MGFWKFLTGSMELSLLLLLVLVPLCALTAQDRAHKPGHVSVVILGGTGDLARKYLWQGFFELYINQINSGHSFSFYGGGLSPVNKSIPILFEVIKALKCSKDVSQERCAILREQFLRISKYKQLKTLEEYKDLSKSIEKQLKQEGMKEAGRLFYLSVPAFAYAEIADRINSSCRPPNGAWLRVVLEKPFGHDFKSAQVLATQLGSSLKDEEMYRIDHYLGKQVVANILQFRMKNKKHLDPLWNKHFIERVEIVLKETLDVKGRIAFYDEYGVIRDVLQNHLTEVLTLLTMKLPRDLSDSQEVLTNKLHIFTSLLPLSRNQAVTGQYQNYQQEVREELNKTTGFVTATPTFAAVLAHIDETRYEDMPILMMSGKQLDERVGYGRVLFKDNVFCLQNQNGVHCKPKQIIFYFGHGSLNYPAILVSKNLFKPDVVDSEWKEVTEHKDKDVTVLGLPISDYYVQTPILEKEAYTELISHIFAGRRNSFVSTENLLASWDFWSPLLTSITDTFPRIYPGGADNKDMLDIFLKGRDLSYVNEVVIISQDHMSGQNPNNFQVMQGKFRNYEMVSGWTEGLIEKLASDIEEAAEKAILESGVFHLALSGGASPLALFHRLVLHHFAFPWGGTHIWMVDERCVPLNDMESNFRSLHDHLLQHVKIPYYNLHPMPVQLNQRLCVEDDRGTWLYQEEIRKFVNASSFHFVLLGVGFDGHTASLFPGVKPEDHGESLVVFTESPSKPHQRMSLTFNSLNRAQKVAILMLGKYKHEAVTQLSRVKGETSQWPVTWVKPDGGSLVWYIDYEALLG